MFSLLASFGRRRLTMLVSCVSTLQSCLLPSSWRSLSPVLGRKGGRSLRGRNAVALISSQSSLPEDDAHRGTGDQRRSLESSDGVSRPLTML